MIYPVMKLLDQKMDISQDKEFYNVKIFIDRVIKLPSVIYYLIKDGIIECI